jgi:uncharacterized protein involved in type VI secretion and phage assembly
MFPFYYFATVTDNQDPDGLGRVRVSRTGEAECVTEWIPVLTPGAGGGSGFFMPLHTGDQALVLVLDGLESRKLVIGGLWSQEARPPETGENPGADLNRDGKNALSFVKSRAGSMFIFDDTEGAEKIQIIAKGGAARLEFLLAEKKISLHTEHDVCIGAQGGVSIRAREIELEGEKEISVAGGEIRFSAERELALNAQKDLSLKGSAIALN